MGEGQEINEKRLGWKMVRKWVCAELNGSRCGQSEPEAT